LTDDEDGLAGGVAEEFVEAFEFGFAADEDAVLISHGGRLQDMPTGASASGMRILAERHARHNARHCRLQPSAEGIY